MGHALVNRKGRPPKTVSNNATGKKKKVFPLNQGTVKMKNGVADYATGNSIFDVIAATEKNLIAQAQGQPAPFQVNQQTGVVTPTITTAAGPSSNTVLVVIGILAAAGLLYLVLRKTV
jgi:LPXTG-motif cell wall-anchored protein